MLVQICHCRVDHGMLLACARHVPPSAKPAEIGVQPRCPIFGIVEESEIFAPRSEEHTSELQSLMRISYAVFCLKKKNIDLTRTDMLYCKSITQDHTSSARKTHTKPESKKTHN